MKQVKYFCDFCGEETDDFSVFELKKSLTKNRVVIDSVPKKRVESVSDGDLKYLCENCYDVITRDAIDGYDVAVNHWEEL